jgi:hypothetical protein
MPKSRKGGAWNINYPHLITISDDSGSGRQFRTDFRLSQVLKWLQRNGIRYLCSGTDGRSIRIVSPGASGSANILTSPCPPHLMDGLFIKVIHNNGNAFTPLQSAELQSLRILQTVGLIGARDIPPHLSSILGWITDNTAATIGLVGSQFSDSVRHAFEAHPHTSNCLAQIFEQQGGPFAITFSERLNVIWEEHQGHFTHINQHGNQPIHFQSLKNIFEAVHQIALGIQELTNRNVVHNDLKPDNIGAVLRGGILTFKLIDFGLISEGRCNAGGTPGFSDSWPQINPPDQPIAEGGAKKDVYALGKILLVFLGLGNLVDVFNPYPNQGTIQEVLIARLPQARFVVPEYVRPITGLILEMIQPSRSDRCSIDRVVGYLGQIIAQL